MKARFDHRCGKPWEDHAPHDFDGADPLFRRSSSPDVGAIKFVDIVVPEFVVDIAFNGFGACIV